MAIKRDNFPAELRALDQWVTYRSVPRDGQPGKFAKIPYNARTRKSCNETLSGNVSSFDKAADDYDAKGDRDGLGLATGNGVVALDIDLDDDGNLPAGAEAFIKAHPGHWQRSPNGGVKGFFLGDSDSYVYYVGSLKIEVLGRKKFTTATAEVVEGSTAHLTPLPTGIGRLAESDSEPAAPIALDIPDPTPEQIEICRSRLETMPDSIAGANGSGAIIRAVCTIRRYNIPEPTDWEMLLWFNEHKCQPPWPLTGGQGLRRKMEEGYKIADRKNERGSDLMHDDFEVIDDAPSVALATIDRAPIGKLPPFNDTGNGVRFARDWGNIVKNITTTDEALAFTGQVWERKGADSYCGHLASLTARNINKECDLVEDPRVHKAIRKHAVASGNMYAIRGMIRAHRNTPEAQVNHEDIDAKPHLFNVQNGTLELFTGTLRAFDSADMLTQRAPVVYPSQYELPALWLENLDFILRDCPDRADVIAFLQRYFGYSLTGATSEQLLLIFLGGGKNGKTTVLQTWTELLGVDYSQTVPASFLATTRNDPHPTALAALEGKRFVHASEFKRGEALDEAKVKQLVDTGRLQARLMHKDFSEFNKTHKIVLDTNHRPVIEGDDLGIWRRVAVVPFESIIPAEKRVLDFKDRLKAERGQILRWAVRGLHDYRHHGLNPPASILAATEEYQHDNDPLADFIEARCELDPTASEGASTLYDAYLNWALINVDTVLGRKNFGLSMCRPPAIVRGRASNSNVYKGIRLKP